MKLILRMVMLLSAAFVLKPSYAAEPTDPTTAITKCEGCHGLHGDSSKGTIPRLNGQQADYLQRRFQEFRDPLRGPAHSTYMMWENTTALIDVDKALALYFSNQTPTAANPQGPLAAQGEKIFRQGLGQDLPACQFCHGAKGEGMGVTPRIAGQHAEYLNEQLTAFALGARVGDPVDRHNWQLNADQIKALTAFLAGK